MRRFSLFHLVICLPVFAGLVFTYYNYRASSILTEFNNSVDYDDRTFDYGDLASTLGESKARKIVAAKANESDKLYFDGDARIVQIARRKKSYEDNSDVIALRTFRGEYNSWIGPNGMRVDSVSFSNDAILINVFGNMNWKSDTISIPEDEALTVSIAWTKNGKATHGDLSTQILKAYITNGGRLRRTPDSSRD